MISKQNLATLLGSLTVTCYGATGNRLPMPCEETYKRGDVVYYYPNYPIRRPRIQVHFQRTINDEMVHIKPITGQVLRANHGYDIRAETPESYAEYEKLKNANRLDVKKAYIEHTGGQYSAKNPFGKYVYYAGGLAKITTGDDEEYTIKMLSSGGEKENVKKDALTHANYFQEGDVVWAMHDDLIAGAAEIISITYNPGADEKFTYKIRYKTQSSYHFDTPREGYWKVTKECSESQLAPMNCWELNIRKNLAFLKTTYADTICQTYKKILPGRIQDPLAIYHNIHDDFEHEFYCDGFQGDPALAAYNKVVTENGFKHLCVKNHKTGSYE